jgi:hypothetical protein
MDLYFNKRGQQILRLDKVENESFYLLDKCEEDNKLIFKICGSTKNIYEVKLYLTSKRIFCNCPDSKSWARKYGVICKHCCFVVFKVLKLGFEKEQFLESLVFSDAQLDALKQVFLKINMNSIEDFINSHYSEKYKNLEKQKQKTDDSIKPRDSDDDFCAICYDEFENITNKDENRQCKTCMKILHKKCLEKWINMGNQNCPYCRTPIQSENNQYKNLFF